MAEQTPIIDYVHNHSINLKSREIYLHGYIDNVDEEPGVDYRMAGAFMKNLHLLDNTSKKPICIHMNTVGGMWEDGMSIHNAIQTSHSFVTIIAYAHARSMSSIIIQAADKRVLMPDTIFMVHYGTMGFEGECIAAISNSDFTKKINRRMLDIYAARCIHGQFFKEKDYSEAQIRKYIDRKMKDKGDWWMDAEEAIYYGFADQIAEDITELKIAYEE